MATQSILLVEDDPLLRLDIAETLREAGFEVIEAGEADSAWALLQNSPSVQLVCTDVEMPGALDGVDLASLVRGHRPMTKLILMSGNKDHSHRLPMTPFIGKPFLPDHLVELARAEFASTPCPLASEA
jgi:DNA-binding NtrC family response regulator